MQKKEIRKTQLQIEDSEVILLLYALQEYIYVKGHEINYSTECLRQKLDNYLLLQPSKPAQDMDYKLSQAANLNCRDRQKALTPDTHSLF